MSSETTAGRPGGPAAWWMTMTGGDGRRQPGGGRGHRRGRGGPDGFGPGFGPGGFGPGGFGPGGPRGRRGRGGRPRRGDVRLALLALLAEQPMHGYQMITELAERSGGAWRPSPGSVYPTLAQLEDEGLVRVEESATAGEGGRRVFHLTDAGRAAAEQVPADRATPWQAIADGAADDGLARLRERAMQVGAAVMQVASAGTDAQVARAEQLLTQLRKDLYRLLAEDDEPTA